MKYLLLLLSLFFLIKVCNAQVTQFNYISGIKIINQSDVAIIKKQNEINKRLKDYLFLYVFKNNDSAIIATTYCIENNINKTDAYFWRARSYENATKYKLAIVDYNKAIEFKSNSLTSIYSSKGDCLEKLGKINEAINDYYTSIDYANKNIKNKSETSEYDYNYIVTTSLSIAKAKAKTGNSTEALKILDDINTDKLKGKNKFYNQYLPSYYAAYAYCYAYNNDFKKAGNSLNNSLAINDSTNFESFYTKGLISFLEGQYIQSIQEFDFAINIGNRKEFKIFYGLNGDCYLQKGLAYLKLNKKEEACVAFKEANRINVFNVDNLMVENCK